MSGLARFATAAVAMAAGLPLAGAQEVSIFTANSSNNQLSLIDFDAPPNVTALNFDANERKSLQAIVVRDDRELGVNLIVADAQAGEICLYADPVVYPALAGRCQLIGSPTLSAGPQLPSALALNADGDLFALSSGTGNASSKTAEIWAYEGGCQGIPCRPGGYADPVLITGPLAIDITPSGPAPTLVTLDLLEEARVVNGASQGGIVRGDLLVLSSQPAALIRLRGVGGAPFTTPLPAPEVLIYPPEAAVYPLNKFPPGTEPGGFAFAPGGKLLITTSTGSVLTYDVTGQRAPVDFASGLGNGKFKIETALQRAKYRAFIADRNGGEMLRFDIEQNGTGSLSGSVAQGVQFPVAVAVTSASVAPTLAGLGVTTSPTKGILESTFKQVQVSGFTSGNVYLVSDDGPRRPDGTLLLSEVDASLPAITIPAHLRGLPIGGPDGESDGFVVVIQKTSAGYQGSLTIELDGEPVLGWNSPCRAFDLGTYTPLAQRERSFWGPITQFGEAPILEGDTVINVTDGCVNPSRGIVREASIFVLGRDMRPADGQVAEGLARIGELLASPGATAIPRSQLRSIQRSYDAAVRAFERLNYTSTRDNLLALAATAATVNTPNRIGAELESRARAAAFAVCSIEVPLGSGNAVCSLP
ncbi:MAG TPA: hypothetical protein VLT59_15520 [Steroidobacteraceae bacterium]|nr:hypothetical protein [Steroidobacteraceae bacterium]